MKLFDIIYACICCIYLHILHTHTNTCEQFVLILCMMKESRSLRYGPAKLIERGTFPQHVGLTIWLNRMK